MEEHDLELIDYLRVIWRRKSLIIGGTLVAAATALVASLLMPKTYEVSRTLKIGNLPGKPIEHREAVIGRLKDHRILKTVLEKIHVGSAAEEIDSLISIDPRTNPDIRYTVKAHDPWVGTEIADKLAEYIIKVHSPIFEQGLQIVREYEAELTAMIDGVQEENRVLKKLLHEKIIDPNVDPMAIALLQANIGERERSFADLHRKLKEVRFSHIGSENTSVIAADSPPQHPVKPKTKLNVLLGGTLGLMGFTLLAFFLEYFEQARVRRKA